MKTNPRRSLTEIVGKKEQHVWIEDKQTRLRKENKKIKATDKKGMIGPRHMASVGTPKLNILERMPATLHPHPCVPALPVYLTVPANDGVIRYSYAWGTNPDIGV